MISRFPSLRLEGGLISSDQIDRIADQKAKEFSIDDIAAAWSDIQSYWTIFQNHLGRLSADDPAISITRNKWMIPFFSTLGYELSAKNAAEVDGLTYAISHRARGNDDSTPVHIVGFNQSLDRRPESGRPRLAPHSLVQEYLNRTEHLWGIVTNGKTLRILRDSNLLRKQAYIEFDLEQIVRGEQFADFALLYRLIHISRLPKGIDDANSCALELSHKQTVEQGGRVRDHLRDGVENALVRFGNGFLSHPRNSVLRGKVQDKSLEAFEYYQQLLRLIYRFLFLMVSEERNLISDNMQYREHYSISRIRRLAELRAAYTQQEDLWLGLATTFKLFQDEDLGPLVGVPTLNGDLFDPTRTSEINEASLTNRDLLTAMWDICMYRERENVPWRRINYAALDVEELGSVYESLLEFQPVFFEQNGKTEFQLLTGTERKSTGSYYTPPELVNELIQSALVPTMKDRLVGAKSNEEKQNALLAMTVCDPACGSGHFLLAAARMIGRELAKARTGDEEPAPEQMRIAIRDSITHCIYGVDKNPLAVDLCKVALWLEGHTKGKPLTFLDHRIRCGDSLVGIFNLSVLKDGIPDDAYTAATNDDRGITRDIKKQNKREREHRHLTEFDAALNTLTNSRIEVNSIADDQPSNIRKKKELFCEFQKEGTPWCKDKTACDLWTAAFYLDVTTDGVKSHSIPTTETVREYVTHNFEVQIPQIKIARQLANKHHFFHWPLEFSEVFAVGGFDCVIGNPPWERIKIQEKEFFATRDFSISQASNKAARDRLIKALANTNPVLFEEYKEALHGTNSQSVFLRESGRFPFTGKGDINTYAVFTELNRDLIKQNGRTGIICPPGIATDDTIKEFFKDVIQKETLTSLYGFINEKFLFPGIAHNIWFCLLTITGSNVINNNIDFIFECYDIAELKKPDRHVRISKHDLEILNPNTHTSPVLSTKYDATLLLKIYKNNPIIFEEKGNKNPWKINFFTIFHMANDSHLFSTIKEENSTQLFEAKMFHQYDHRFASFSSIGDERTFKLPECNIEEHRNPHFRVRPYYYIKICELEKSLKNKNTKKWLLGYRAISKKKNYRSFISSIIPYSGAGHTVGFIDFDKSINTLQKLEFFSLTNSLIFDYCIRQKISGVSITLFILKQLPVIPPDRYTPADLAFIVPRVLELTYTAWDIKAFADDVWRDADDAMKAILRKQGEANKAATGGHEWKPPEWAEIEHDGIPLPPFKWDEERRAVLRAELDALYARLYGLSRDELRYILDPADVYGPEFPGETFRVLKEKEIKKVGEYRTRRLVLEAWDRMDTKV